MDDKLTLAERINAKANEILEKSKCVRCSNDVPGGGPGARCSSCRKKLNAARQTPGHTESAQAKAQQAKRREDHGNGTATKKSKGKAKSNAELVDKVKNAEKKTGQRLSLDRKDNSKGYAKENTRMIPDSLNRGRHTADPKKLKAWKDRLKKTGLTEEELLTLAKIKVETSKEE